MHLCRNTNIIEKMKLGIYFNGHQVDAETVQRFACNARLRNTDVLVFDSEEEIPKVDRLIVLGGDGTVLRAARKASEYAIPLVGVNFGTLGFLTEFERNDIDRSLDLVFNQNCPFVRRTMLEVDFNGVKGHYLNEFSLLRRVMPDTDNKLLKLTAEIDGSAAGDFTADGLIVSTPTGSTAYSLSAGGNIMTPDCETFLLTPVCAFSLRSRPIAYSDKSVLSFHFAEGHGAVMLYGDGMFMGIANAGDALTVRKSDRCATFLTADKGVFFRRITEKIN